MRETGRGIPEKYTRSERGEKVAQSLAARREQQGRWSRLVAQLQDIQDTYGPEALTLIGELASHNLTNKDEVLEKSKDLIDYERAGQAAFEYFEKEGAVEELSSETVVVDEQKIRELDIHNFSQRKLFKNKSRNKLEIVYHALKNRRGIGREDYESGNLEPKDILYIPEDEESAFNPEKTKNSKFVVPLWETIGNLHGERKHPTKQGREINLEAVQLATLVYHPKYGDATRDEQGQLLIRDPKTRKYRPVTHDLIRRGYGFRSSGGEEKESFAYGSASYLRDKAPELLQYDLLRETDFRSVSTSRGERPPMRKEVYPNGIVMINGVRHNVGRGLGGRKVALITPDLAGILEEKEGEIKLSHTFNVLTPNQEFKKGKLKSVKEYYAGAEVTQVTPFNPDQLFKKRPDESEESYEKRTKPLKNFETVLNLSKELYRRTGLRLEDFSFQEQIYFALVVQELQNRKGELLDFAAKFGKEGIQTFISVEYGLEHGQRILEIAEALPASQASEIFRIFSNLSGQAETESEALEADLRAKHPDLNISREQIAEALLGRARDVLDEAYLLLESGKQDRIPELIKNLRLESGKELVLRSEFMKVINLLNKTDIKLFQYEQEQRLALRALDDPFRQAMYLRSLEILGRLAPIPEIHWRVDRSLEEYDRRLGMDLESLLSERAKLKPGQKLLEIGPGSGMSRKERSRMQSLDFKDYALSDKVYYPPLSSN